MDPTNGTFLGLKDKVVLITGSSSGLGAKLAADLASLGARLSLTGRNEDGLKRTVRECLSRGLPENKILTTIGDITKMEDCRKITESTIKYFGHIDILVNNVGIVKPSNFENCSVEMLDEVFDVNVHSMIKMTRCVIPSLQANKGCIVNISSFTSHRPMNDYISYCLSKAAVEQFTKNLALELGQIGIRVNSICPGIMGDTEFWIRPGLPLNRNPLFGGMVMKRICSMYPMNRASVTKEVIPSIIFLMSEKCASFITGTCILIDGGKALTSAQP